MPSSPVPSGAGCSDASLNQTSNCLPPAGNRNICGASELVTYADPAASIAMSLQKLCLPANSARTLPAPVFRSKPITALPLFAPTTLIPLLDKSSEQTHKVLEGSSARTPRIDALPKAPGLIHTSGAPLGLIRTTPPSAKFPTYKVPSRVDDRLSGNARSLGKEIDAGAASAQVLAHISPFAARRPVFATRLAVKGV